MKETETYYCTDMMLRRIANREPVVAYMAHPYGGKKANIEKACDMAEKLADLHPRMAIINPLDNFRHLEYFGERDILAREKQVMERCDVLIMTGDWKKSPGCMGEFSFAYNHDIPIIEPDEESARFFHPAVFKY
ncbi:hypothetical protein [uncultured Dialister sp.]|uniref:hypothetical protein n=1 Tax=uncultured Dialister sp. TaxID=278064 RepID=UPI0027DC1A2E|nr:hypothetical protein [uncultured Dialister sp.]